MGRGEPDLKFSDSSDSQLCPRALKKSTAIDGRAAQPPALSNNVRARRGDAFPGAQQQRTWTTLTSSSGFATDTIDRPLHRAPSVSDARPLPTRAQTEEHPA